MEEGTREKRENKGREKRRERATIFIPPPYIPTHSVPELRFSEPQSLTSDQVKELTEEVEKLAQEKVGEVSDFFVTKQLPV